MNQDQLETHVRDAIVRETTGPGASVALWQIGERVGRTVPGVKWPALVPAVAALEERGVLLRGPGQAGQTRFRFAGLMLFDAEHQERIIFPDGAGGYVTAVEGLAIAAAAVRIPQVA